MKRAGQKCSYPRCTLTTSGPGFGPTSVSNTGRAAHIYSASENGPRGTGGLSCKERQSIDNGIWLCSNHAEAIDKNNGSDYPADLLRRYKKLHEERTRLERDGISKPIGWVHSLRCVTGPSWFKPAEEAIFGKITIIHGTNGSGKTTLCNWLEGLSNEAKLLEWSDDDPTRTLGLEFNFLDPVPKTLRIRVISSGQIEYFVDGEPVPFSPNFFRIIRIKDPESLRHRHPRYDLPDLDYLSAILGISVPVIKNILNLVSVQNQTAIPCIRLQKDEKGREIIWASVEGTFPGLSLQRQLSGSERLRILVELSAIFARYSAMCVPTVLIFNGSSLGSEMHRIVAFLSNDKFPFQTVIESLDPHPKLRNLVSRIRLEDPPVSSQERWLDDLLND